MKDETPPTLLIAHEYVVNNGGAIIIPERKETFGTHMGALQNNAKRLMSRVPSS